MLVQIWLGALKSMIYVWGLVEAQHQTEVERHNSSRPMPKSENVETVTEKSQQKE